MDSSKKRKFSHKVRQFYILSLVPIDFIGNVVNDPDVRPQEFLDDVLKKELGEDGQGIVNLNVTTEFSLENWLFGLLVSLVPVIGNMVSSNVDVNIEGEVLEP